AVRPSEPPARWRPPGARCSSSWRWWTGTRAVGRGSRAQGTGSRPFTTSGSGPSRTGEVVGGLRDRDRADGGSGRADEFQRGADEQELPDPIAAEGFEV